MKIALYGATGMIGQQILQEALRRGHDVTAIVRDPARLTVSDARLSIVTGDITDASSVAHAVAGHDIAIASISGRRGGDVSIFSQGAQNVIAFAAQNGGAPRLLWIGGAGSLNAFPGGPRLIDTPEFPAAYKAEAQAQTDVLETFRRAPETVDWSFFSPAAEIAPGERKGAFRLGGDTLLSDAEGNSRISVEDFAVAVVDEVESNQHSRQRFTIAY